MSISYSAPLQRSWARARSILLGPFRLETWLVLGFAAFLSEWTSGGWSQAGWQERTGWRGHWDWPFHDLWPALVVGPLLAGLVALGIVVGIVLLWVGSRGKFVFLDDVLHGRAAIVEPWNLHARLGQSLFLWKLVFLLLTGVVVGGVVAGVAGTSALAWIVSRQPLLVAPPIVLGLMLGVLLGLAFAFVGLMLDDFVVPLMYRHGISATEAWRRFLPLLRSQSRAFVLYALMILVLWIAVAAVVAAASVATCCVGFLLLALPYVAQVVLLPIHVTFRGLGPEFLAQFGPEWDAVTVAHPPQPVLAPPGPGTPA